MSTLKGFFDIFEELVIESCQKLGTILLNKIFRELAKFKMVLLSKSMLVEQLLLKSFKIFPILE